MQCDLAAGDGAKAGLAVDPPLPGERGRVLMDDDTKEPGKANRSFKAIAVCLATLVALVGCGASALADPARAPALREAGNCENGFGSAPLPVGTGACAGVRPGALLQVGATFSGGGEGCTFAFMFRGSDGARYMGTAGHCAGLGAGINPPPQEKRWAPGKGPLALDAAGKGVGRFVYAVVDHD